MAPTTTTTTTPTLTVYPPLPWLAPRAAGEAAEQYGLRALLFITAERLTCTVDQEGLELAQHTFRLAVCNPALTTTGADRLADVGRMITGALARRQAETEPAQEAAQEAQAPAGEEKPRQGPGAPLAPRPKPQAPPSAGARPPQAVTGPAGIPARHTAISPALAVRPAPPALDAGDLF